MRVPLRKEEKLDQNSRLSKGGSRERQASEREFDTESDPKGLQVVDSDTIDGNEEESPQSATRGKPEVENAPLFPENELRELQSQWDRIQTGFVDQPQNAVHDADALVSSAIRRLAEIFEAEHSNLEQQWDSSDSESTENLRVALQRYRSFFHRVLSI